MTDYRITNIFIDNIYPLNKELIFEPKGFNLIYGPHNESGKTLIFDILSFVLFGKDIFKHKRFKRVQAEITLLVDNRPVKLNGSKNLIENYNFTPDFLANIFCVRSSDFEIKDEKEWWKFTKEHLSGLTDINRIKSNIRKISFMPETKLDLNEEHKQKIKILEEKLDKINKLIESDFYNRFIQYNILQEKIENLKTLKNNLELAKIKSDYKIISNLIGEYNSSKEELNRNFKDAQENIFIKLRELEIQLQNTDESIRKKNEQVELLNKRELENETEKRKIMQQEKQCLGFQYEKCIELITEITKLEQELQIQTYFNKNYWLVIVSTLFAMITVILSLIFRPIGLLVSGILFIPLILNILQQVKNNKLQRNLQELTEKFKKEIRHYTKKPDYEIKFSTEMRQIVNDIQKLVTELHDKLTFLESIIESDRKTKDEISKELYSLETDKKIFQKQYDELLLSTGCRTISDLTNKLEKKRDLERKVNELYSKISTMLNESQKTHWNNKLAEMKIKFAEKDLPEYDETKLLQLSNELEKTENKIKTISAQIEEYKKQIYSLGLNFISELYEQKYSINEEISEIKNTFESGKIALEILDGIFSKQEQIVESIFSNKENSVSKLFSYFTGGRYSKVIQDANGRIKLITQKGKEIDSEIIKGSGTFDQLYLSIRLALCGRLLNGKGFLLLDDPFLRSDRVGRTQAGLKYLFELVDNGWQIFYFTLDPLIEQLVTKEYARKDVTKIELEPLEI